MNFHYIETGLQCTPCSRAKTFDNSPNPRVIQCGRLRVWAVELPSAGRDNIGPAAFFRRKKAAGPMLSRPAECNSTAHTRSLPHWITRGFGELSKVLARLHGVH